VAKQVIPTVCQTGCILKLDQDRLYSASESAATVFDLKQFPIAHERLRKKLYYFSTSRPADKDELPSNPDNAFRDAHGKPVLVLNARNQLCVALLPDEIYPRWLGSTWQYYVTEEEREEYERECEKLSQGLLVVLVSLLLQFLTGVVQLIQEDRQKSLARAREELQKARQLAMSKKSQPFFYGWKEKAALPALLCLLVVGSFWSVWWTPNVSHEVSQAREESQAINEQSKQESPLTAIENRMTQYKKSRIPSPINRGFCSETPRIQMFASISYFGNNSGVKTPQMIIDTPP